MSNPLSSTFGIWLIALFLQSILYGMGLIQAYLYFFWYHKDNWGIKGTVITMPVLETFQSSTFFAAVYAYLIEDFGHPEKLAFIPWREHFLWQSLAQLCALYTSTFVAQTYFASSIYFLRKQDKILPTVIVILSLVGFGAGIAQVFLAVHLKQWIELPKTSAATNTQAALSLTCDVLITVGLCWRLHKNRTGIQSTNRLLNFLIMTAINRGVLTMITALLNMILLLTQPGTFYFQLMLLLSGKFYMNSMLAMLNTRQHAYSVGKYGNTGVEHISMPSFSSGVPAHSEGGINISVTREIDLDDIQRRGKSAF
ncbi:hypothetical protein B0H13DRAFT_2324957 [Mycena leptocephala]|nr:hypothetical protein B0H13DRAFT_2324957 [Mycena leptocephala]